MLRHVAHIAKPHSIPLFFIQVLPTMIPVKVPVEVPIQVSLIWNILIIFIVIRVLFVRLLTLILKHFASALSLDLEDFEVHLFEFQFVLDLGLFRLWWLLSWIDLIYEILVLLSHLFIHDRLLHRYRLIKKGLISLAFLTATNTHGNIGPRSIRVVRLVRLRVLWLDVQITQRRRARVDTPPAVVHLLGVLGIVGGCAAHVR